VVFCRENAGLSIKTESMQRLHEIRELLDAELDLIKIRTHVVMSEWINNLG